MDPEGVGISDTVIVAVRRTAVLTDQLAADDGFTDDPGPLLGERSIARSDTERVLRRRR